MTCGGSPGLTAIGGLIEKERPARALGPGLIYREAPRASLGMRVILSAGIRFDRGWAVSSDMVATIPKEMAASSSCRSEFQVSLTRYSAMMPQERRYAADRYCHCGGRACRLDRRG